MNKTLLFILCSLFVWSCNSKQHSNKKVNIAILKLDSFKPQTTFDKCFDLETYQLLGAASQHLEQFISNELLSEGEDLTIGYQRFVEEWTGRAYSEMNTELLLNDEFANALYANSNFKNIWIPLVELGDTIYTEELAYDEKGNEVVVKYIENYLTLNTGSKYYQCLKQEKNAFIQNYLINKEYGNIEPQDFAMELSESLEYDDYNNPLVRQLITTELYLRIIAIRNQQTIK